MSNKDLVKLPFRIFLDEKAIENEVAHLRQERENVATRLRRLTGLLRSWLDRQVTADWAIGFVSAGEYETDLLEDFRERHAIDPLVKREALATLYPVPDYSQILTEARSLKTVGEQVLPKYWNGVEVEAPEVSKVEKEAIIERHSIYIRTEKTHRLYVAISHFCEGLNILNFELASTMQNRILKGAVCSMLPTEWQKFIELNQPEPGTQKRRFVPNFERFKDQ